jgi:hypothetical protein
MWLSLLEPNLISNDLMGIVDGTEPCPSKYLPVSLAPGAAPESSPDKAAALLNPAYTLWVKRDQFTLSWINSTLSELVLSSTVYGLRTSHLVWTFLASKFASQTRTRIAQLQRELYRRCNRVPPLVVPSSTRLNNLLINWLPLGLISVMQNLPTTFLVVYIRPTIPLSHHSHCFLGHNYSHLMIFRLSYFHLNIS